MEGNSINDQNSFINTYNSFLKNDNKIDVKEFQELKKIALSDKNIDNEEKEIFIKIGKTIKDEKELKEFKPKDNDNFNKDIYSFLEQGFNSIKGKSVSTNLSFVDESSDKKTAQTDVFLQQWLQGELDQTKTTADRFNGLKTQGSPPQQFTKDSISTTKFKDAPPLDIFSNVKNIDDLKKQVDEYYKTLGKTYSTNEIAQMMGKLYSNYYSSGTGGAIPADINAFDLYNKKSGVCVQIHAGIAAYRQSQGQEAYVITSSSVANPHVFLVFKDGDKWYIQNYGTIVETDARHIKELFDKAMPEEVRPRIYKVNNDGGLKPVAKDFLTNTGIEDRRFSDESGIGDFNPFNNPKSGFSIGNDGISFFNKGIYTGFDPNKGTLGFGYYNLKPVHEGLKLNGFGIEGNVYKNQVMGKWEMEKRWLSDNNFGRYHFSLFGGVELGIQKPIAWNDLEAQDRKIGKLGVSYSRNDSWLFGSGKLKLETGYDTKFRGVWSYALDDNTKEAFLDGQNNPDAKYYGDLNRMYGDLNTEFGGHIGTYYKPTEDLTIRTGTRLGIDLSNFDALKKWDQGLLHTLEPSTYFEMMYKKKGFVGGVLAELPFIEPRDFKIGAMAGYTPNDKLTFGTSFFRESILGQGIDTFKTSIEYRPTKNLFMRTGVELPIYEGSELKKEDIKWTGGIGGYW